MDTKSKNFDKSRKTVRIIALILTSLFLAAAITEGALAIRRCGFGNNLRMEDVINDMPYAESVSFASQASMEVSNLMNLLAAKLRYSDDKIEAEEKKLVKGNINNLNNQLEEKEKQGMIYYAESGDVIISSSAVKTAKGISNKQMTEYFATFPAYYVKDSDSVFMSPLNSSYSYRFNDIYVENGDELNGSEIICLAFTQDYLDIIGAEYNDALKEMRMNLLLALLFAILMIVSFIILMANTGDRDEDGTVMLNTFDRCYSEIQVIMVLAVFICGGLLYLFMMDWALFSVYDNTLTYYNAAKCALADVTGFVVSVVGLLFIESVVKKMKAHVFFRQSIISAFVKSKRNPFRLAYRNIKLLVTRFVNGGSVMRKVICAAAAFVLVTIAVMFVLCVLMGAGLRGSFGAAVTTSILMAIGLALFSSGWTKHAAMFEEIRKGASHIREGDMTYKIKTGRDSAGAMPISFGAANAASDGASEDGMHRGMTFVKDDELKPGWKFSRAQTDGYNKPGELEQLAEDINSIAEGFQAAVDNELKSQRMKTDLISNVSHDIKTPLTSLITYVDLLKKEGLNSPEAGTYLDILDEKSQRLKKLTEDLFEAAKASSGSITVNYETVELMSLLNQGLGEMSVQIEEKQLNVIVSGGETKYYMRADGKLVWRIMENLLNNLVKYALEGSRVYIDVKNETEGGRVIVVMTMKNISKYQLNISTEELLMRFKRGDESRTTEGSGLGLAIARDLAAVQSGSFDIQVDGDLFKAVLKLPASEAPQIGF